MPEWKYDIYDGHLNLLASGMTMHDALLFCKALFEDAWTEPRLTFAISRKSTEGGNDDGEYKDL